MLKCPVGAQHLIRNEGPREVSWYSYTHSDQSIHPNELGVEKGEDAYPTAVCLFTHPFRMIRAIPLNRRSVPDFTVIISLVGKHNYPLIERIL